MRTNKTWLFLFCSIVCIGLDAFAEERVVRVAGDPYPPWTEGAVGSETTGGIAVEIVEELFRRLDMKTRVVVYPFERGLKRIEEGNEDIILMVSKTKEREKYTLFTSPIRHSKWVFYYLKGKAFEWSKWKDLQKYRIGYVTGNNVGKEFPVAAKQFNFYIEEVKADIFNVKKLLLRRIDIILTDLEVMQRIIQQHPEFQGKMEWYDKPVFESFYHFGVSKNSFLAPMFPRINEVLQEMKDDGTFQKIFCLSGKQYQGSCENE